MRNSARIFSTLNYLLMLLIVLTIGLLTWHHFGMNRVFRIDASSTYRLQPQDDRSDGGKSVATLKRTEKSLLLDCDLDRSYAWPYCEFSILLAEAPKGVDLTGYDTLELDLSYTGPGPNMVRFYIRNYEQGISNPTDWLSMKINEIEFEVPPSGKVSVPIKLFHVASWWITEKNVPLLRTDMRIDNVPFIELTTASLVKHGKHRIEVRSIAFHGKWMSQARLLMLLVGAWVLFGMCRLIAEFLEFRAHLSATRVRIVHLQSINRALQLETEELAGQVRTDPLTGALNREGLRDYLVNQWDGASGKSATCVIIADIDHFKDVNDRYGHVMGDEVLRQFVNLIQHEIRSSDRLIRWGGEEFLILCSHTQLEQASNLAEKLRLVLVNSSWPQQAYVSSSFGVTAYQSDEDFGDMINRADHALYRAKANGRNCVETA